MTTRPKLLRLLPPMMLLLLVGLLASASHGLAAPSAVSIYDDDLRWSNWSWGTSVQRQVSSPTYAGSASMGVTFNQAWAGLSLHTSGVDTTQYSHLEFALRLSGQSTSDLSVSLYDSSGRLIRQIDPSPYASLASNGWYEVSIPLADLGGADRTITRVQLQEDTGGAQPTFYLDQLRLVSQPTNDGPNVSYVYDDRLAWSNWSWGTSVDPADTSPLRAGSHSLSVTFTQGWAGLSLHNAGFDTSGYKYLVFAAHTGGQSLSGMRVALYDAGGSIIRQIDPASFASPAADGWQTVRIPLSALGAEDRTVSRVQWQEWTGRAQTEFNLDEVRFEGSGSSRTPPPPSDDSAFRIIVLPDTQRYSENYPHIFEAQTRWIATNAEALNIKFVLHEGDIVQHEDSAEEWRRADRAMRLLDDAGIPYGIVPGNADHPGFDTNASAVSYNAYFGPSRFSDHSWYRGNYHGNENSYQTLAIGGRQYLFLNLDWCPSSDEVVWANDVLSANPDHRAILNTHAYLNDSGGRTGIADCRDTEYIWDDLIKHHANLQLVLSGHMHTDDGQAYRMDWNWGGRRVHQMLANYQDYQNGGNGWLRILEFHPSADRIDVKTYSPYLDRYMTGPASQFSLVYP